MSEYHVNQIKSQLLKVFKPLLPHQNNEINLVSKALGAFGARMAMDFSISNEDIINSIVDGCDDGGIDVIYCSDVEKKIICVQSKFIQDGSGEPDQGSILKFCEGIKNLINRKFDYFKNNSKINFMKEKIEKMLDDIDTKIILVLIHTGNQEKLAHHAQNNIDSLIEYVNDGGEEDILSTLYYNQSTTHKAIAGLLNKPISEKLLLHEYGKISDPYKAYYGYITTDVLYELWQKHKKSLFAQNLRLSLGTTDVNGEIKATLETNPDLFWYFNNGITIIARSIGGPRPRPGSRDSITLDLKELSIVNGAQTVTSIGKYLEQGLECNAKVLVRIIETEEASDDFAMLITKTNNRQNKIENQDFASQDQVQKNLKNSLNIEGYDYRITRSSEESSDNNEKCFDIKDALIGLCCLNGTPTQVVSIKSQIGKAFENYENNSIYKTFFNNNTSIYDIINSINIIRYIDKILKKKINELDAYTGPSYGLLTHGNRLIQHLVLKKMKHEEPKINKSIISIQENKIESFFSEIHDNILEILENIYPESRMQPLFKNRRKCEDIVSRLNN